MTGRDLIIYILENNLEDEPIFKDGRIPGFISLGEAAEKMNVGLATVLALINQNRLNYIVIGNSLYIPSNFESPFQDDSDERS